MRPRSDQARSDQQTSGRRFDRRAGSRLLAVVTIAAVVVLALVPLRSADAAPPVPTPAADSALTWLAGELAANGGTIPGFLPGVSDWGVTADAILAFVAAGRATDAAAVTATDALAANQALFTTWAPDMPAVRVTGATGKTLLVLLAMGRPATVGGVDLEAELRSLMVTSGDQAGRFVDRVPDPAWDSSNGFAQSLSILALALTSSGVPEPAVSYLLAQQCPSGGFRLNQTGTAGCTDDATADTDATGLALQALLALTPRSPAVASALDRGFGWLLSRQDASTGAFGGTGPTAAANTNSSGVIAQALRAAGLTEPADRAAAWITNQNQLTAANAGDTPASIDVGAIAHDPAALTDAITTGIADLAADQWRRSTTQGVLALGLSPYGPQSPAPLQQPPATTTTTTTTSVSTTTQAPAPPTTTATTANAAVDVSSSSAAVNSPTVSPASAPSVQGRLALTGTSASLLIGIGILAIGLGLLVTGAARARR